MPLVEFACPVCGKRSEELVRSTAEAAAPPCPSCGGRMERVLSSFATRAPSVTGSGGGGCGHGSHGGFS